MDLIIRAQNRKMTEMSAQKAKTDTTEMCMTFEESQLVQSAMVSRLGAT